jgi:hypothetical protein
MPGVALMLLGWQCPACGTVYAPHVAACPELHAAVVETASGSGEAAPAALALARGLGSKALEAKATSKAPPKARARHTYTPAFEEFFAAYPSKRGKFPASKRYAEALAAGATEEQLLKAATAYDKDRTRNPDKTKHAEGWLHDRRWEDVISPSETEVADRNGQDAIEETERYLRDHGPIHG